MIKQISIFLENKQGQLSEITGVLKDENINIMALQIAEAADYGLLRLIVKETEKAVTALNNAGYITRLDNVVGIHVPDEPGGLHGVLEKLSEENVNIAYSYSVFSLREGQAYLIFKVDDPEKVEKLLKE